MALIEIPYFMTNEKWYYYDEKEFICKLTPEGKKNKKVVNSYCNLYRAGKKKDEIVYR